MTNQKLSKIEKILVATMLASGTSMLIINNETYDLIAMGAGLLSCPGLLYYATKRM